MQQQHENPIILHGEPRRLQGGMRLHQHPGKKPRFRLEIPKREVAESKKELQEQHPELDNDALTQLSRLRLTAMYRAARTVRCANPECFEHNLRMPMLRRQNAVVQPNAEDFYFPCVACGTPTLRRVIY